MKTTKTPTMTARAWRWLLCAWLCVLPGFTAAAGLWPEVEIDDAYAELHTGPGRGYPVFQFAALGERVQLLASHTDWIKLRTARGQQGWVPRAQLRGTLVAAGAPPGWRERFVQAALHERVELGAAFGAFESEPMARLFARVRLGEALGVELTVGQVQGLYSGTDLWHVAATVDPLNDLAWSPYLALGVGRFRNVPNASLVETYTTNANLLHASLGLRWRFGGRYTLRAEATLYTALLSDRTSREYRAFSGALSFFF